MATLVILAAGMGSRYGGLKQIDGVGSHGEPIIDFSIYDAKQAGFDKVVLIIRPEHEEAVRKALTDKIEKHIEVGFAYQELKNVPEGIVVPEGREKPWGTTSALLSCKGVVNEPFCIINADDYYGRSAYKTMLKFLNEEITDSNYGMIGYQCKNTLTEHGSVTRGICEVEDNLLTNIQEIQKIELHDGIAVYEKDGEWIPMSDDTLVSMNFWGFTPKIFEDCEPYFEKFLKEETEKNPMKCELVIPTTIGDLINDKKCTIKVMSSEDEWFGVTYREDKPYVVEKLQEMKDNGVYPDHLWD